MRIDELIEHNKGDQGAPISMLKLESINQTLFHYFHKNETQYDIYKAVDNNQIFYIIKHEKEITGYVMIEKFDEKVWQVKSSYIYNPANRGRSIGSETYMNIATFDHKSLISDNQLSSAAEKLWTNSLPKSGRELKIYDTKEKSKYSFDDIGKTTKDGEVILDPAHDNERDRKISLGNFDYTAPRFYYLLEGNTDKTSDDFLIERMKPRTKNINNTNYIADHLRCDRSPNMSNKSWY
ncbi:MAG: hypothetical protein HC836_39995 [Richelia sp. RM2_1_2]|nr:hypothetical protein [Richelia sp. RM2_1_2]